MQVAPCGSSLPLRTLRQARLPHVTPGNPRPTIRSRLIHHKQRSLVVNCIGLGHRDDLTQQHGYIHAGVLSAIADTAGGYAGFTLFPAEASVLTVEYKINLLAPGDGESFVAEGRVIKPGRTLCIVRGEVYAIRGERRSLCALMQQTLMVMHGKSDQPSTSIQ